MSIRIIKAQLSHASVIAAIGKQSFRDAFGSTFTSKEELKQYLDYTYNSEKIRRSIEKENNVFFIVYIGTVPVGFAKVKKHSLNEQIESISQMELQKIYVLSFCHGTGAGAALMQAVLDLAKETQPDFLWLDVYNGNHKAIHFYEKNGFTITGKYFFTIGTQTFEYHLMSIPVTIPEVLHY